MMLPELSARSAFRTTLLLTEFAIGALLVYAVLLGLARAAAYSGDAWRARRLATVRGGDQ
jgi:hypothetical protein